MSIETLEPTVARLTEMVEGWLEHAAEQLISKRDDSAVYAYFCAAFDLALQLGWFHGTTDKSPAGAWVWSAFVDAARAVAPPASFTWCSS